MANENNTIEKVGLFQKFLNAVEVIGNKLPAPAMIFVILSAILMVVSAILANQHVEVIHPGTGDTMVAENLLSVPNIQRFLGSVVSNFQGFPPLGLVLAVMIGAGLAEKTDFLASAMKMSVINLPNALLTVMIFFIGILGNLASDAAFIIMPPLAATMFLAAGRHPLVGLFAAYAGVAAGFSANLLITTTDILAASFTIPSAETIDPNITLTPAMNLYFLWVSTFVLTAVGTFVTEKIIAPRFENDKVDESLLDESSAEVTPLEKRGVRLALLAALIYIIIIALLSVIPIHEGVPFMVGDNGQLLESSSTFMRGLVPLVTLLFFIPGLVYGIVVGKIKNSHDMVKLITQSMNEMGSYIVLAFFAAQFIALFNQSNIGIILAVNGAAFLTHIGLQGGPLWVAFILFCGFINLFIGSASAKWAMLAPIFIPMFMLMGYDPAQTQMAFRIGDSITNPISPLFSYMPMILAFASKYRKNIGLGTIISNMLPYSIIFGIVWIILFLIFFYLGIPLGPA